MSENIFRLTLISILSFFAMSLLFFILKLFPSIFIPLTIASLFYFTIQPIVSPLANSKHFRMLVPVIVVATFFLLIIFFGLIMYGSFRAILDKFPVYREKFSIIIKTVLEKYSLTKIADELDFDFFSLLRGFLTSVTSSSFGFISQSMMTALLLFFITLENVKLKDIFKRNFENEKEEVISTLKEILQNVSKYLYVKALASTLTAICVYMELVIFKVNFPLVWLILVFLFNWIPAIGSIVITILIVLFAVIQFFPDGNFQIIMVAICSTLPQIIIGNIIEPKMLANSLKLSPIFIVVSLILWSYLWGPIGMFLAVPITVTIKSILSKVPSIKRIAEFI